MKNKYVKSVMGLLLSVSLIAGGSLGVYAAQTNAKTETATEAASEEESEAENETTSEEEIAEQNAVYGEVKKVDGDTITFTVGTRNEIPGKGDKSEGEKPESDKAEGEKPTGAKSAEEEKTSDSEKTSEAESKDLESNDSESNDSEKEETPDKPDGEKESFLTLTSEEREITVSEETEIVKGMMPEDGKPENEKPEGNKPEGDAPMAEEENQKDTEAVSELKEEKLTVEDIKAGDVIKVTYDKDNNVTRIEVMSTPEAGEKPENALEDMTKEAGTSEEATEDTSEVATES